MQARFTNCSIRKTKGRLVIELRRRVALVASAGIFLAFGAAYGQFPPLITGYPTNRTVLAGATVSFVVSATGADSYQWGRYFQGPPESWQNLVDGARISGATTPALMVDNTQSSDSGNYFVTMANAYGSTTGLVSLVVVAPSIDLITNTVAWNTTQGGIDFSYSVTGGSLNAATTAKLFWANGGNLTNILSSTAIFTSPISAGFSGPSGAIHVPASNFQNPPTGATHIVLVVDPDNLVSEADENNNSLALQMSFTVKLFGPVCDTCPTVLQETNVIRPSIFRVGVQQMANTKKGYALQVQITNAPPNTPLRIFIQPEENSGGHYWHTNGLRKHGWLFPIKDTWKKLTYPTPSGLMNAPTAGGTTDYGNYDSALIVNSGSAGATNLLYVAPEISGIERIIVLTENAEPSQRLAVTNVVGVRVEGLVPLAADDTITLAGQRCAHPSSWNGTTNMITALKALAKNYSAETGGNQLQVNDVALPLGGMFDIGPTVCAGETPYNAFWAAGAHFGHRLGTEVDISIVPPNTAFERILNVQGWWLENPTLWTQEGNHYHLNLAYNGRVTIWPIDSGAISIQNWDSNSRELTLAVTVDNRGGLDANTVTVQTLTASSGVIIESPTSSFNLNPMPMAIRETRTFVVTAMVPKSVNFFMLRWVGTATGASNPNSTFAFDHTKTVGGFDTSTSASSATRYRTYGPSGGDAPQPGVGDWSIAMAPSDQQASTNAPLVYNATIANNSGADIYISDLSLWFRTPAAEGSYEFQWAPEFFNTGGRISAAGYSGPLVNLLWHSQPPAGTVSIGEIELKTDATVPTPVLETSITCGSPALPLAITQSTNSAIISWSSSGSEGLWIESSESLDETEWLLPAQPIIEFNRTNSVTVPIENSVQFFRLNGAW